MSERGVSASEEVQQFPNTTLRISDRVLRRGPGSSQQGGEAPRCTHGRGAPGRELSFSQLFVDAPHPSDEGLAIDAARAIRIALFPVNDQRPFRSARLQLRQCTHHISRSFLRSSLEHFHIAATTCPLNLSSGPTSPSTASGAPFSCGFVIRSTDSPLHPAACRVFLPIGGDGALADILRCTRIFLLKTVS